jgi:hypothetical protein
MQAIYLKGFGEISVQLPAGYACQANRIGAADRSTGLLFGNGFSLITKSL